MLAFFPTLHPDELLYSGIARYHFITGDFSQKNTINNLFENKLVCATVDLPSHLQYISKRLDNVYKVNQLIMDHTLYPYYKNFLSEEKAKDIYALMSKGSTQGEIHMSLGLVASSIKRPRFLKYCKECFEEDMVCYNEPYWHRSHQVPGVYFCPIHKIELTESNIYCHTRNHKFQFVPLIQLEKKELNVESIDPKWKKIMLIIADKSNELLKNIDSNNYNDIANKYKVYLNDKNYITARGRTRFEKLISDFCNFFTIELLDFLNCNINANSDDTWFHKIIKGNGGGGHPLRHILLHIFLDIKINEVKSYQADHPFGHGPWPCLNKAAEHFKKETILKCNISRDYKSGLPVGTFKCSCGFEYSRKGPDKSIEDRLKIGRIKSFGDVWLEKLNECNQLEISIREKARILGVDPMTVKKYINNQLKDGHKEVEREDLTEITLRREKFLVSIKQSEEDHIPIRQLNSKDYMWLYRNDPEWLKQNKLQPKKSENINLIVDWKARDNIVFEEVKNAFLLLQNENPPRKITIAELSRKMNSHLGDYLHNCLGKLKRTNEYIESIKETTEAFQIRRLEWAANELRRKNFKPSGWELLKLAGLNKPLKEKVEVKYNFLIAKYDI